MAQRLDVIDVSHYQGAIDFAAVKASGIVGVIAKATEGSTYIDDMFLKNRDACEEAELGFATYHYLKPDNITDQMHHYLDTVEPAPGERVVVDFEDEGCTLEDLHEAVKVLMKDPRQLQITVYSGHLIKQMLGDEHDRLLSVTSLWLAQYTTGTPSWPKGTWDTYSLWQYTDKGKCPGVSGNVDSNQFNGSKENCVAWFGPPDTVIVEPPRQVVTVNIQAPEGIDVLVSVNGEER